MLTPTVTLGTTPNPSVYGSPVVFKATVTGSGPIPTGAVQFVMDGVNLGIPCVLDGSGVGSMSSASLPVGARIIEGYYVGDLIYNPASGILAGGQNVSAIASVGRINRNLRWVKRQCDLAGHTDILEEEILDALSSAELEICERSGSVKQTDLITFDLVPPHDTGVYALPSGSDRIVYIAYPPNWERPMILTNDPMVLDNIKKGNVGGNTPLVVLVWKEELTFWPIPTTVETITVYSYRTPTDAEVQVEGVGDPILSRHWDPSLRYMALATLLAGDWVQRADTEYNREAHHHIQESSAPILLDHSSNRLGF